MQTRILGWGAQTTEVALPAERLRVADLVRAKVTAEWAEWEEGTRAVVGIESLAPEQMDGVAGPQADSARSRSRETADDAPAVSLEGALRSALDGYRSGWYIILVDGEEPGGLDRWLSPGEIFDVAFIRVYPLPPARDVRVAPTPER